MVDLTITLVIPGRVSTLAGLAGFLRTLEEQRIDFSLTLASGDWEKTYVSWRTWAGGATDRLEKEQS